MLTQLLGTLVLFSIPFVIGFFIGKRSNLPLIEVKQREYQENIGEKRVNDTIELNFDEKECHLLKNITVADPKGGTTQIDHILVCKKGIFVIETKHYTGWIFGSDYHRSSVWKQTTKKGQENFFQNPIRQNYKHVQVLKSLFPDIAEEAFHSVIVFSGDAEFKTDMPGNVIQIRDLKNYFLKFEQTLLSEQECCLAIGTIQYKRRLVNEDTDESHVRYLKSKYPVNA